MNESNAIETLTNTHPNWNAVLLSEKTKLRLNEIIKIKDYFNSEIQERKTMSKKLSKYIAVFDCIEKTLTVLSATSVGISIIFHNCYWSSCSNNKWKFYVNNLSYYRKINKLLKIRIIKKKKHC